MSTTNNNFTVEGLVVKYRNYVNEHCQQIANECGPCPIDNDAEEQLLITLYNRAVGDKADKHIQEALSKYADVFYSEALDDEEMAFLLAHFSEASISIFDYFSDESNNKRWNYGLEKPSQKVTDFLGLNPWWWNYAPNRPSFELQKEVLETGIKSGMTIFIANSGYCDIPMQFPNCTIKGFTHHKDNRIDKEVWALGQIRLYAAGIKSEILPCVEDIKDWQYMEDVDYAIWGSSYHSSYERVEQFYQHMRPNSKLLLFLDKNDAAGETRYESKDLLCLRKRLVEEKSISTIVSFEEFDNYIEINRHRICIFAKKVKNDSVLVKNSDSGQEMELPSHMLDAEILWPSYYMTLKPKDGIALSEIVSFHDLGRRWEKGIDRDLIIERENGEWKLSDKARAMSVVRPADMAIDYKDANLCEAELKVAGDAFFEKWIGWLRKIEHTCVLLYGKNEKFVVGYINRLPDSSMATLDSVVCLIPKKGIDVRYVAALLLTPEVRNQIMSICEGEVNDIVFPLIMDKVMIPNHSEKERLSFLAEANYEALLSSRKAMEIHFEEKLASNKAKYINEVRMRKHDMGQYIFEMINIEDLIRYYLENRETETDFDKEITNLLDNLKCSLKDLDSLLKNLSQEEQFNEPENDFDINDFLFHLKDRHKTENYKISYECDSQSVIEYWHLQGIDLSEIEDNPKEKDIKKSIALPLIRMSPIDITRMAQNIFDNARKHGFTDQKRKDYEVRVCLSIDNKENMYHIDFINNGNPLPRGIDKKRYGLRGEKAGNTGGSGIGGDFVRSFVEHYNGDYDVFMKDGWVVIRILIPIK